MSEFNSVLDVLIMIFFVPVFLWCVVVLFNLDKPVKIKGRTTKGK